MCSTAGCCGWSGASLHGIRAGGVACGAGWGRVYAAAEPVVRQFVVADARQHIFIEPIANQVVGESGVEFFADASSGLPVDLYIDEGPEGCHGGCIRARFSSGSEVGLVQLRASQPGGSSGASVTPRRMTCCVSPSSMLGMPMHREHLRRGRGSTGSAVLSRMIPTWMVRATSRSMSLGLIQGGVSSASLRASAGGGRCRLRARI